MKIKLDILKQRSFLLFLVVATALWYVNKLAHTYKAEVEVPVEIIFDYNSLGWVENPKLKIRCLVEGVGSDLQQYKLSMVSPVSIPMSNLSLTQMTDNEDKNYYLIGDYSMIDALRIAQNNINVIQIMDTIPWIEVSPMENITLPVRNKVVVNCADQFMVVGQVKLQPAEINVKAPKSILDTLKSIATQEIVFEGQNKSIQGNANLIIPKGVITQEKQVRYNVDITGYTELEYKLSVEAENLPDGYTMISVPSKVTVLIKVPLSFMSSDEVQLPVARINYNDRETQRSNLFRVNIKNLPAGSAVKSVNPEFVEPFFERN